MTANYKRLSITKRDVNNRRVNKERLRSKLAKASFVNVPRLVKKDK